MKSGVPKFQITELITNQFRVPVVELIKKRKYNRYTFFLEKSSYIGCLSDPDEFRCLRDGQKRCPTGSPVL